MLTEDEGKDWSYVSTNQRALRIEAKKIDAQIRKPPTNSTSVPLEGTNLADTWTLNSEASRIVSEQIPVTLNHCTMLT